MTEPISRRALMQKAAQSAVAMSALSYGRILGANDRMQIGQIGCGNRGAGLRRMLKASMQAHPNIELRSVCDLWSVNRQRAADHVQTLFGARPKMYQYSEEMLADRDLDAVIVSTGDHQHARILAEVVKAGKDCYCEKPMANTLEDAKLARDTVKASGRIVQMGSQWLSDPYQLQVRELIRGGKIGKVVSISQSWNFNGRAIRNGTRYAAAPPSRPRRAAACPTRAAAAPARGRTRRRRASRRRARRSRRGPP